MKKYELVGKFEFYGKNFFQVKALVSFGNIKAGELGGYVEKEENLSQIGTAWVRDDAVVCDRAWVRDRAVVRGRAVVRDRAEIITISNIGSRLETLTIFRTENGFSLATGCFYGTFEQFKKAVSKKQANDEYRKEYEALYSFIELKFNKYLKGEK